MTISLPVIANLLAEQQQLTAVERFKQRHEAGEFPTGSRSYQDLIPLGRPGAGEQYAFHVDLDACTGCKACVVACHRLNGLDEGETWRFVGVLEGGTSQEPVQQTVTTTCHHCLDPACMHGCPVNAYEKDPTTGIVRHLADQCIGCSYCTLTCPYEVPQFNEAKGIVRKCDMCADRLAEGEAPACVQACPNEAISIRTVELWRVLEDAQADAFVPTAPDPGITLPTTTYETRRTMPRNLLPADFYALHVAPGHTPLVVMLVLTQLAVGSCCAHWLLGGWLGDHLAAARPDQALFALLTGLLALGASLLHLGRPLYAFRVVLGLRTSWLSREILAFTAFSAAQLLYVLLLWNGVAQVRVLAVVVVVLGLLGVYCSAMVYSVTRRRCWNGPSTALKFFGTSVVLGLACSLVTATALQVGRAVEIHAYAVGAAVIVKLLGELSVFRHLRGRQRTDMQRTALLLAGELASRVRLRLALGLLGGILLPGLFLVARPAVPAVSLTLTIGALLVLTGGELMERMLFYRSASPPRMPGGVD